jgi:isobutyryl-CoA mutase
MGRLIQDSGAEVVHLGHNRSVRDVVRAAVQEDADAIAISSYQGGHIEYFRYVLDMLADLGASDIRVFGGGGGTITPREIAELREYGVGRLYHPNDGMKPLEGLRTAWSAAGYGVPVVGITGTGGAGKSTVTDELLSRFMQTFNDLRVAVLAIDPTRRRTGGALLGDRIRMNSLRHDRVYMRSMATRRKHSATSAMLAHAISFLRASGFDLVIVETAGIGQSDSKLVDLVDLSIYVMTSEFGAASQLEKIDMLDLADIVVINKFERSARRTRCVACASNGAVITSRSRPHQQPAHQRLRRGDHDPDRGVGAPRARHPAHHQPRARAERSRRRASTMSGSSTTGACR